MKKKEKQTRKRHLIYISVYTVIVAFVIIWMTGASSSGNFFENPPKKMDYCGDLECQNVVEKYALSTGDVIDADAVTIEFVRVTNGHAVFDISTSDKVATLSLSEGDFYEDEAFRMLVKRAFSEEDTPFDGTVLQITFIENKNICPIDCTV